MCCTLAHNHTDHTNHRPRAPPARQADYVIIASGLYSTPYIPIYEVSSAAGGFEAPPMVPCFPARPPGQRDTAALRTGGRA